MLKMKQGTEEWLEFRKNKIGASDAPVILGVSPWMTPHALWEEKLGLKEPRQANENMRRGNELEETARLLYIDYLGKHVEPVVLIHPDHNWIMASLDGLSSCGKYAVEIKCPGIKDHAVAKAGFIPDKYYPQLQHQLAVTGLQSMHYMSYFEGDFVVVTVDRDNMYIEMLILTEKRFWNQLQNFEEPDFSDGDFVKKEDSMWVEAANKYMIAKEELARAEDMEKFWKNELVKLADGKSSKGAGICLSKIVKKGNVDYSKIKELESVDLEQYRKKSSTYWRVFI